MSRREKYRIRMYNNDPSVIRLERKFKCSGLGYKESALLTQAQACQIAGGDIHWMAAGADEVLLRFYTCIRNEGLAAKVIVDYIREPFVFIRQCPCDAGLQYPYRPWLHGFLKS